jgi:2,5-furandicarboxylate decarboxylase 1
VPKSLRDYIDSLEAAGELIRITKPVDPLHISAVIKKTDKAVLMEKIVGYDMPVVGGICRDRKKVAAGLGMKPNEVPAFVDRAIKQGPLAPVVVDRAPCHDVVITGDDVDLTRLPYTFQHENDGGPYIGSAIQFGWDPEYGSNCGMYRMMFRTKNTTGIDFNSPSDLRLYYERTLARGKGLPIAVSIGTHIIELMAAAMALPLGQDEMGIAGRLHGEPVEMVKCKTVDLMVPAQSEIVLEGEILPTGWTTDEGRFGEFHKASGEVKWNPVVKVNAITHRRDAIFYSLLMPDEVWGIGGAGNWKVFSLLQAVGVQPVAVRAGLFQMTVSIKNTRPGQGKTAVTALLSMFPNKIVTVVDDDIDIFDDEHVRWALALRFQPDKDLVLVSGLPAKHMDASVYTWTLPPGQLPVTSKMGIDATIKPDMPRTFFEPIRHFMADEVDVQSYYDSARKK